MRCLAGDGHLASITERTAGASIGYAGDMSARRASSSQSSSASPRTTCGAPLLHVVGDQVPIEEARLRPAFQPVEGERRADLCVQL